ncbi:MAG: restriction endonuclease subunit S [Sphingobacteriales bacterium]|nr:restriction endonuclease subunit S [Sphingobacteriales bacterium]
MSWKKVKMGEFLINRESRFKPKDKAIAGLKRIDKIDFSGTIYLSDKPSNTDMIIVKRGDLVISGINVEKGAMSVYQDKEDITATIHYSSYCFDETKIDIEFLKMFLKSPEFKIALKEQVPGGIKTEIKPKHLLPLEVSIPTLVSEQKEIVKQFRGIETVSSSVDTEIITQQDLVNQLRQSFLREAMQGKLVKQDPKDGHAKDLLEKIKAEKAKSGRREKELPHIKPEEIPFEIPENWVWCRLGEIISFGPSNGYSPKESKKGTGIKCLTLTATTSGKFKGEHYKLVDEQIESDSYLWLSKGDILLQRGNALEYVGIAALYEGESNEFIYPDLMIKVRVFEKLTYDRFIHKVLISPFNRTYFSDNAFGAQKSMPKINQGVVLNTMIPLPPLNEQYRIVDKIINIMTLCDDLQQSIQLSREQNELLLQQVLKETLNL